MKSSLSDAPFSFLKNVSKSGLTRVFMWLSFVSEFEFWSMWPNRHWSLNMSDQDDRSSEEDEEQKLFEFGDFPSFGSLQTCFQCCTSKNYRQEGCWRGCIFVKKRFFRKREPYFKGQYLHLTRSDGPKQPFEIGTRPNCDEVVFLADELFEPIVQVGESINCV